MIGPGAMGGVARRVAGISGTPRASVALYKTSFAGRA
jgi:hypothetical protein